MSALKRARAHPLTSKDSYAHVHAHTPATDERTHARARARVQPAVLASCCPFARRRGACPLRRASASDRGRKWGSRAAPPCQPNHPSCQAEASGVGRRVAALAGARPACDKEAGLIRVFGVCARGRDLRRTVCPTGIAGDFGGSREISLQNRAISGRTVRVASRPWCRGPGRRRCWNTALAGARAEMTRTDLDGAEAPAVAEPEPGWM